MFHLTSQETEQHNNKLIILCEEEKRLMSLVGNPERILELLLRELSKTIFHLQMLAFLTLTLDSCATGRGFNARNVRKLRFPQSSRKRESTRQSSAVPAWRSRSKVQIYSVPVHHCFMIILHMPVRQNTILVFSDLKLCSSAWLAFHFMWLLSNNNSSTARGAILGLCQDATCHTDA